MEDENKHTSMNYGGLEENVRGGNKHKNENVKNEKIDKSLYIYIYILYFLIEIYYL